MSTAEGVMRSPMAQGANGHIIHANYKIPAGTEVSVQKGVGKWRKHVTRLDLYFVQPERIGYGGQFYYFKEGEWLISVNRDRLEDA